MDVRPQLTDLRSVLRQLWRLTRLIRPYRRRIAKSLMLGTIVGLVGLVVPWTSKLFFDDVYPRRDIGFMHVLVLAIALQTVVTAVASAIRNYYAQLIASRMSTELSLLFFNHLQHLEVRLFDERRAGDILSRSGDLQRAITFVARTFQTMITNGAYALIVPPILFALNWRLALLSLIGTPLIALVGGFSSRRIREYTKRAAEQNAEASGLQYEIIANIRVIKSLGAESESFQRIQREAHAAQQSQVTAAGLGSLFGLGGAAISALSTAVFSWYAWSLILRGTLSVGSFIAFTAYLGYLRAPVGQMVSSYASVQQIAVSLSRLFEYLDAPLEHDPRAAIRCPHPDRRLYSGALHFEGVTFGYGTDAPVLRDVTFCLDPGEVVAFVGRSGAGKSSLAKLMLRMYQPQGGRILLGSWTLPDIPMSELRRSFGVVWQDNGLIRGTLRENLLLGCSEIRSNADLWDSLWIASADDFVRGLPRGLDTDVSEAGNTLSGGQRQRIAIARALLRPSPILLFDEATSNLDPETERQIVARIIARHGERTLILITHRMAAARAANRIFVVDHGLVAGGLAHSHLYGESAVYRSFVDASRTDVENHSSADVSNHQRERMVLL